MFLRLQIYFNSILIYLSVVYLFLIMYLFLFFYQLKASVCYTFHHNLIIDVFIYLRK